MKKNKILSLASICLVFVFLFSIPCLADTNTSRAEAADIPQDILASQGVFGKNAFQSFVDGFLTENAGIGAEFYILALAHDETLDFSSYEEALLTYLKNNKVSSASSRLKYALCLSAIGSTDSYILQTIEDSIGKQGLMSFIFGLHLLNNGYQNGEWTASIVKEKLLSLQHKDGGFSVSGEYSDVDATAMTVQALAPYYKKDADVAISVENALAFLSARQSENGDFSSYGVPNPESTAQVMIALSALGIDSETDGRFIKNGNTLWDGILKYRLPSGDFCHTEGGDANEVATVQVFLAATAYLHMQNGEDSVYLFDRANPENAELPQEKDNTAEQPETKGLNIKAIICLAVVLTGGIVCLVLFICKKRNPKNFLAVLIVTALIVCAVLMIDFQSVDDYYNGADAVKENPIGTVTMEIRCDTVAGREKHIPENGVILTETSFVIEEGDTVYQILTEAAKKYQIQIENNGTAKMAYISGIAYLYEFDFGDLSGWQYSVNGERPSVSAGAYVLKDGDTVVWEYTLDLGKGE
ncbi:MAG: DUF4430 domain-containing protein [Clostridia bacterium]|nr:DUF4430 domain-containing protein [Clostridia bacterium]